MKRKGYFILSSIIQIIASIYSIINANELAKELTDIVDTYAGLIGSDSIYAKNGNIYIIVIAIICILLNSLVIWWSVKNKLLRNKGKVIACSVGMLLTSTQIIIELLAIVNLIVIASSKRVNPEDFPSEKGKLPTLEREEMNKKNTITAIILLVIYFSQFIWSDLIPENRVIVVSIIFYITMIILSIILFKDLLKNNIKVFENNFKTYYQNLVSLIGKYYLLYFLSAIVAAILAGELSSANQQSIKALPLWLSMPLAIIYAPIVEETLFRGCIRRFIKNDKLFIVVSALIFGLLHTVSSEATIYNSIVMAIPYATMGGFLAYLYTKTNNILCNMSFHCFHNTIAMIIMILIR